MNVTDDDLRAIHVYGPIHDDHGHHITWGCLEDHEAWPCHTMTHLTGQPAIPRTHPFEITTVILLTLIATATLIWMISGGAT